MALILLIVVGAVFGWLAAIVTRTESSSAVVADIGLGAVGSVVFGLIANNGAIFTGLRPIALLASVLGAVGVLFVYKLIRRGQADA